VKIVYLAGPYLGRDYNEIEENIRVAEKAAIELWNLGYGVFCPHLNTAHFECKSKAPPENYLECDLQIMQSCDMVVMLPGWWDSPGACKERRHAMSLGIPVDYMVAPFGKKEESMAVSLLHLPKCMLCGAPWQELANDFERLAHLILHSIDREKVIREAEQDRLALRGKN